MKFGIFGLLHYLCGQINKKRNKLRQETTIIIILNQP